MSTQNIATQTFKVNGHQVELLPFKREGERYVTAHGRSFLQGGNVSAAIQEAILAGLTDAAIVGEFGLAFRADREAFYAANPNASGADTFRALSGKKDAKERESALMGYFLRTRLLRSKVEFLRKRMKKSNPKGFDTITGLAIQPAAPKKAGK